MSETDATTITIQKRTLNRLKHLCIKAETYDQFLNRLLDLYERAKQAGSAEILRIS